MHSKLWRELPKGFLKWKDRRLYQLKYDVMQLVVQLAKEQKFKCALCSKDQDLIIEHDHEALERAGIPYTIDNIRGLVCGGCNSQLSIYEREERGEYIGLDNVSSRLSSFQFKAYTDAYKCRRDALREVLREGLREKQIRREARQPRRVPARHR